MNRHNPGRCALMDEPLCDVLRHDEETGETNFGEADPEAWRVVFVTASGKRLTLSFAKNVTEKDILDNIIEIQHRNIAAWIDEQGQAGTPGRGKKLTDRQQKIQDTWMLDAIQNPIIGILHPWKWRDVNMRLRVKRG